MIGVGDKVVLKDGGTIICPHTPSTKHTGINCPKVGSVSEVVDIYKSEVRSGFDTLHCGCLSPRLSNGTTSLVSRLRKIKKADEDFTAYMRKMKPKQTEKPRCPLTGEPLTVQERFEQECG